MAGRERERERMQTEKKEDMFFLPVVDTVSAAGLSRLEQHIRDLFVL